MHEDVLNAAAKAWREGRDKRKRDRDAVTFNEPEGRQAVLRDDKWMLANAAFCAGQATPPVPVPAPKRWEVVRGLRAPALCHLRMRLKLAASTRKPYDRIIEEILEKNADKDVKAMTRQTVRAIHRKYEATPRKADWYVQVISLLLNFAKNDLDWKVDNVAAGIELYGKQREYEPWPDWMVAKLTDAPVTVRSAAELILGTGQRPKAAISMRRDDFRGEWMEVLDEKGGEQSRCSARSLSATTS